METDWKKKYEDAMARMELCERTGLEKKSDYIFPELRESEDEKMLKRIRLCLDECVHSDIIRDYERDECVAYLEKQKEQDKCPEYCVRSHCMGCSIYEKQKEQKHDEGDFTIYHPLKNGKGKYECIPYSFYGSLTSFSEDKDLIDFLRTCFYTEEECNEWIKQQKEQKPAEWSEEDKKRIKQLIYDTEFIKAHYEKRKEELGKQFNNILIEDCDEQISWLKSLHPQSKVEWGEEDVYITNVLEYIVGKHRPDEIFKIGNKQGVSAYKICSWLKSLRPPQYCENCKLKRSVEGWKPSEEQMEAQRVKGVSVTQWENTSITDGNSHNPSFIE